MNRDEAVERIRDWVNDSSVSKRGLSVALEVSRGAVQKWGRGTSAPVPERVPDLGRLCGRAEQEINEVREALAAS